MKRSIAVLVIGLFGAGWALGADTRLILPPDLAMLKARLIVNKDTYTLDPAQKGAEFRKKLRQAPAQNAQGIPIQRGRIQIRAVPVPAPAPAPKKARALPGKRIRQAAPNLKKQPPAAKEDKEKKEAAGEAKGAKKEGEKEDDVQVEGDVQGVIVVTDGQGKTVVKDLVPTEQKKNEKAGKGGPAKKSEKKGDKEKKETKEKKDPPNVQSFKVQAQGGQIQIQGRIQIQGGVPGGQPQVQIFVVGGPQRPLPPEVDMELELTNTSGREMTLLTGGGRSQVDLSLEGPGAMTTKKGGAMRVEPHREIKLAPGATHRIPVKRLQHGPNGRASSYWTEPGEYTLKATYKARIKPAKEGEKEKAIEVSAPAVKIHVVEKK